MPTGEGLGTDTETSGTVLLDVHSLSKTFPGQLALDRARFRV